MGWIIAAIGMMGGFLGWYQTITIRSALADFKESIRTEFGARFLDATLAAAKLEPMLKDISHLTDRLNGIEEYMHKRNQEMSSDIQECKMAIGVRRINSTS